MSAPLLLLDLDTVADRLGLRHRTVLGYVRDGRIESAGALEDGTLLFDMAEVTYYVRFRARGPRAPESARMRAVHAESQRRAVERLTGKRR